MLYYVVALFLCLYALLAEISHHMVLVRLLVRLLTAFHLLIAQHFFEHMWKCYHKMTTQFCFYY